MKGKKIQCQYVSGFGHIDLTRIARSNLSCVFCQYTSRIMAANGDFHSAFFMTLSIKMHTKHHNL